MHFACILAESFTSVHLFLLVVLNKVLNISMVIVVDTFASGVYLLDSIDKIIPVSWNCDYFRKHLPNLSLIKHHILASCFDLSILSKLVVSPKSLISSR